MIGADDLPQFLGIVPSRQRGRPHQIAKHHRELATFGGIMWFPFGLGGGLKRGRDGATKLGNRCQHPSPMPEQDADVLEILIGQMAENREINAILGEALGVVPQPEFVQPRRDRLHCSPLASTLAGVFGWSLPDLWLGGRPNGVGGLRADGYSQSTQIRRRIRPIGPNAPWAAPSSGARRSLAGQGSTPRRPCSSSSRAGPVKKLLSYKRGARHLARPARRSIALSARRKASSGSSPITIRSGSSWQVATVPLGPGSNSVTDTLNRSP